MPLPIITIAVALVTVLTGAFLNKDRLEYQSSRSGDKNGTSPLGDADRDGFADWKEYLAGTNPNSPASHPEIPRTTISTEKEYEPPVTGGPRYSPQGAFRQRTGGGSVDVQVVSSPAITGVTFVKKTQGLTATISGTALEDIGRVAVVYGAGPEREEIARQFVYDFQSRTAEKMVFAVPPLPAGEVREYWKKTGYGIISVMLVTKEDEGLESFPVTFNISN